MGDHPHLPDYAGPCISNIVPALLEPTDRTPEWLPGAAAEADQVVLLVLDGLGWDQLEPRRASAPCLASMAGGPISTVVPSTTATALTSIATGLAPGDHGVVGYRVHVEGEVLNVLRWTTPTGDARGRISPLDFQPHPAFCGHRPPIVTKAEFATSGFSGAHLSEVRFNGYRVTSTLVTEVRRLLGAGEPFIYAYYDVIDKVAHEYGVREHYDAELVSADRLVADLAAVLPRGAALVVTADHGQVDVGDHLIEVHPEVRSHVRMQSGEARFRWLHARTGQAEALLDAASAHHGDQAWVRSRQEMVLEGWFGPNLSNAAARRLGDVALVAQGDGAFIDAADSGPFVLVGRHGSLTSAEMRVPLLATANT
ncbi:alkaline phosphatase family protein [soil metagenome]